MADVIRDDFFTGKARKIYALLLLRDPPEMTISEAAYYLGYYSVTASWQKIAAASKGHLRLDGETLALTDKGRATG